MPTGTLTGDVTLVEFDPCRHWYTFVRLQQTPDGAEERWQIDGATLTADDRTVTRPELLAWLTWTRPQPRAVRVKLTGYLTGGYQTVHAAEFYQESAK
jgi:hypothetical protein